MTPTGTVSGFSVLAPGNAKAPEAKASWRPVPGTCEKPPEEKWIVSCSLACHKEMHETTHISIGSGEWPGTSVASEVGSHQTVAGLVS